MTELTFDRAPQWLRPGPDQLASLERCWGRGAVAVLVAVIEGVADDIADTGFEPGAHLGGGIAGIAIDGRCAGRRAVVKISPGADALERQARAMAHWGPGAAAEVLATGDFWVLLAHAGTPVPDPLPECHWELLGDLLDRICAAGPLAGLPGSDEILDALVAMARARPASAAYHGPGGLDALAASATALTGSGCDVVAHGDLHDGNLLADTAGTLRVIDPEPRLSTPAEDRARWILGGGSAVSAHRARWVRERWGRDEETRCWVTFLAAERAGALVHHGKSLEWAQRFTQAASAAAREL